VISRRDTSIVGRLHRSPRIIAPWFDSLSFSPLFSLSLYLSLSLFFFRITSNECTAPTLGASPRRKCDRGRRRGVESLNDCRARLHQRVARNAGEIRDVAVSSSRKRPSRPRNKEKKNPPACRHLALRRERRRKTRESRRQCFNPSRALLRAVIDAYASSSISSRKEET